MAEITIQSASMFSQQSWKPLPFHYSETMVTWKAMEVHSDFKSLHFLSGCIFAEEVNFTSDISLMFIMFNLHERFLENLCRLAHHGNSRSLKYLIDAFVWSVVKYVCCKLLKDHSYECLCHCFIIMLMFLYSERSVEMSSSW